MMIQRKQTIFLILVAVSSIFLFAADAALFHGQVQIAGSEVHDFNISVGKTVFLTNPVKAFASNNIVYALIVNVILSVLAIFSFRKLALQLRLTAYNFLFMALAMFYIFYALYRLSDSTDMVLQSYTAGWALSIPFLMIIFNFLALRGIRKDIELLASADRLR